MADNRNRFSGGGFSGGGSYGGGNKFGGRGGYSSSSSGYGSGAGYESGKSDIGAGVSNPMDALKKAGFSKGSDLSSSDIIRRGKNSKEMSGSDYFSKSGANNQKSGNKTEGKTNNGENVKKPSSLDNAIKYATNTDAAINKDGSLGFSGEKKVNDKDNAFLKKEKKVDENKASEYAEYMDMSANKFFYASAYLGVLFFIPLLIRDSLHGKFHAAQGGLLLAFAVLGNGIFWALDFFLAKNGYLGMFGPGIVSLINGIYNIIIAIFSLLGIVWTFMGKRKKLPLIGRISKIND